VKRETYTIHDQPGKIFDCSAVVEVHCDGETLALEFPQLRQELDNINPMVWASMKGTRLTITLSNRDDTEWVLGWCEESSRWRVETKPEHVKL
jgi:hypothetical protein